MTFSSICELCAKNLDDDIHAINHYVLYHPLKAKEDMRKMYEECEWLRDEEAKRNAECVMLRRQLEEIRRV